MTDETRASVRGASGPVFLSFSSHDQETADRLCASLEHAKIRCWLAHRDIPGGDPYPAAITAAIASCGALLVLISEASNTSPHVLREVELAFNARKPILPVRLKSAVPSSNLQYFLSTTQWMDAGLTFDDNDSAAIEARLVRLLSSARDDTPAVPHRWRVAAILIAAGALIAGLAWHSWSGRAPAPAARASESTNAPGSHTAPAAEAPVDVGSSAAAVTPAPVPSAASDTSGRAASSAPEVTPPNAPSPGGAPPLRTRVNRADGQIYVRLPAGEFLMGCSQGDPDCDDDERPVHLVKIDRPFWIGRTEVTIAQYLKGTGVQPPAPDDAALPVTEISWHDARAYCGKVGGRLPTEAEWEYAARAGTHTHYFWGDKADAGCAFKNGADKSVKPEFPEWSVVGCDDGVPFTASVASYQANAFGLHDMTGNVWEWVQDCYDPRKAKGNCSHRVIRGGSWSYGAADLRTANREPHLATVRGAGLGFRVARSL